MSGTSTPGTSKSLAYLYPTHSIVLSAKMSISAATDVWPSKYALQREPIPEIPRACVEKLLLAMDKDVDGRISKDELKVFADKSNLLSITPAVVDRMFDEIAKHRPLVHATQLISPITLDELAACCTRTSYSGHS